MLNKKLDSLGAKSTLMVGDKKYTYFNTKIASEKLDFDLDKLPFSMRVLFENLLRNEDGKNVTLDDIKAVKYWIENKTSEKEIAFHPARVLMQDFTGVPAIVDLAAMRDATRTLGGDPQKINPLIPVDLVIDHSVQVDEYGTKNAFTKNVELEMERNKERYKFLRWGQQAFANFRVVPPGTGICHQVNLEYLAKVVWSNVENGETLVYPDSLVGTDSHTTMVNGLAVLGWGVGGIEAEAAMLGQPISMLLPEIIGFKLTGTLSEGVTATDLVLTVTEMLREKGVVGKFVEFYGAGLSVLGLSDRATIANMAPEYGATCGFFPIDRETIRYLELSGRPNELCKLVEEYAKIQGMWRSEQDPIFTDTLELDLGAVEPSLAGPKRPQDRVSLKNIASSFKEALPTLTKAANTIEKFASVKEKNYKLGHGDVVISAITSCTNTSNPSVMIAAGLVARKANKLGLRPKEWVKTSLAPGSQVVSDYLEISGLQQDLDDLGFNLVGYGCATCIGNSGPLKKEIEESINNNDIVAASVISGNRNFEGRIHPLVKANYLASPPLVVAYALAGNVNINLATDPIGQDKEGNNVFLKDIWPSLYEIKEVIRSSVSSKIFEKRYNSVFEGTDMWRAIKVEKSINYGWDYSSTYINNPPYFRDMKHIPKPVEDIINARILAILGDSITTDHISPAGDIAKNGPAAKYLTDNGVGYNDFNSYGARRGNHEIMMRGTFANIRIKNEMVNGVEGGYTKFLATNEVMPIFDAAMKYIETNTPLVVFAGKEYGTGSSRDWAAKGTRLLGVQAVIAESFERIHRSNLIGMGIIPLTFKDKETRKTLNLTGEEIISIKNVKSLSPKCEVECIIKKGEETRKIKLICRIDTASELEYFLSGGILQYVIRNLNKAA